MERCVYKHIHNHRMPRWLSCSMGWSNLVFTSSKVINCILFCLYMSFIPIKYVYTKFVYYVFFVIATQVTKPSWWWSCGSWIYSYLTLWVRIPLGWGVLDTTLCDNVCQWLVAGRWFSLSTPVYSTNKADCHDIAEILLKVALNTITLTLPPSLS